MPSIEEALASDLSELFGENVAVSKATQQNTGATSVSMGTMSYRTSSTANNSGVRYRQTVVVLTDESLNLPRFVLQPRTGGVFGTMMEIIGMAATVDFPDSPTFSRNYLLQTWTPKPIQVLFTPELRAHFERFQGWSVRGEGRRLVIFRTNQECSTDELETFARNALQLISLFQQGEQQLDQRPDLHRDVRHNEMETAATQVGGLAGHLLQHQLQRILLTDDELQTFVAAFPPRAIPSGMRRQVVGDNWVLMFVGAFFCLVGAIGGSLWLFMAIGNEKMLGLPFLISFPLIGTLIGTLMVYYTWRHRNRKIRTLRDGRLTNGTIKDIRQTSTKVNGELRFHVTICYQADDAEKNVQVNSYGAAVSKARELKNRDETTRVLIDPRDAGHVICLDLLIVSAPP